MKTLKDNIVELEQDKYSNINIEELLTTNNKIITFVGSKESGTSFIVNTLAELLSARGINVGILDATRNKSSYYIYTKNEEGLRKVAISSIENLINGIAEGIKINENLRVYTDIPRKNDCLQEVKPILGTLLKNHSVILIDCDFETPVEYFEYSQEIYLIQSMNILSIQPFTEALAKFEDQGILDIKKLRIIINKFMDIPEITEKEIIGGLAFYNEPSLSYMKQLFNKDAIRYMTIPFEENNCITYLKQVMNCNIDLNQYSATFLRSLEELAYNVYPFIR